MPFFHLYLGGSGGVRGPKVHLFVRKLPYVIADLHQKLLQLLYHRGCQTLQIVAQSYFYCVCQAFLDGIDDRVKARAPISDQGVLLIVFHNTFEGLTHCGVYHLPVSFHHRLK